MRYLILLLVVVVGILLWRRSIRRFKASSDTPERPLANMVQCQVCGVYLPQDEALHNDEYYYCTVEHRDQHAPTQR